MTTQEELLEDFTPQTIKISNEALEVLKRRGDPIDFWSDTIIKMDQELTKFEEVGVEKMAKKPIPSERIIEKVNYSGKWMEFWFEDSEKRSYDESCKSYMFWDLVESRNLDDYILHHGIIGMRLMWVEREDRPTEIYKPKEDE